MTCPYLVVNASKKICKRMLEDGLTGAVSDFDLKHYCKGNPFCCYYFRFPPDRKLFDWHANRKKEVKVLPTAT